MLTESLGLEEFCNLFPVILTDNGSEFSNPERLEATLSGQTRPESSFASHTRYTRKGRSKTTTSLYEGYCQKALASEILRRRT